MPSSFPPVYPSLCTLWMISKTPRKSKARSASQTPLHSGSAVLRRAVRRNIVSFPSQIPVFLKRPPADMQWRIVLLYFVRGWTSVKIGARFNVSKHQIRKILDAWSVRALALGYVQVIDPEAFAACCHTDVEYGTNRNAEESDCSAAPVKRPRGGRAVSGSAGRNAVRGRLSVRLTEPADLIAALDAAIAHCEEWPDEFWVRTATLCAI